MKSFRMMRAVPLFLALVFLFALFPAAPASAAADTVEVTNQAEFLAALDSVPAEGIVINVKQDFTLTQSLFLRAPGPVVITSRNGSTIDVPRNIFEDAKEIFILSDVTLAGDLTLTGDFFVGVFDSGTLRLKDDAAVRQVWTVPKPFGYHAVFCTGRFFMDGGRLTAEMAEETDISNVALYLYSGGEAIVTAGKIEADIGISLGEDASLTMTGGEINAEYMGINIFEPRANNEDGSMREPGRAALSGGRITGDMDGVSVGGILSVSGDCEISGGSAGVHVWDGGEAVIDGGTIRASTALSVYGSASVNGGHIQSPYTAVSIGGMKIDVSDMSAAAIDDAVVTVRGGVIDGGERGVYVCSGAAEVTVSSSLSIKGGLYTFEGYSIGDLIISRPIPFLSALPEPVSLEAGASGKIALRGVSPKIQFQADNARGTISASVSNNTASFSTNTAGSYSLALTATHTDEISALFMNPPPLVAMTGTLTLLIPVTVTGKSGGDLPYVPSGAAVAPEPEIPLAGPVFSDIGGHWAEPAIEAIAKTGVIKGYPNGTFRPNGEVTRAEFVSMLMRLLGAVSEADASTEPFADIKKGDWYYEDFLVARSLGIVQGDANGNGRPNAPISRQELFTMTHRALEKLGLYPDDLTPEPAPFSDIDLAAEYALIPIQTLAHLKLANGSGGKINPGGLSTRAEATQFLYNIMKYLTPEE